MLIPWRVCILHRYLQTLQSRGVPMVQDGDEANAPGGVPVANAWQFGSVSYNFRYAYEIFISKNNHHKDTLHSHKNHTFRYLASCKKIQRASFET